MKSSSIYRGFDVKYSAEGGFTVWKGDEQISDRLATEEKAYDFIDAHIRRGGK